MHWAEQVAGLRCWQAGTRLTVKAMRMGMNRRLPLRFTDLPQVVIHFLKPAHTQEAGGNAPS